MPTTPQWEMLTPIEAVIMRELPDGVLLSDDDTERCNFIFCL